MEQAPVGSEVAGLRAIDVPFLIFSPSAPDLRALLGSLAI